MNRAEAFVLAALSCLLPGPGGAALAAAENPDFTGSWELNEDRSDDPRQQVDEAMRGLATPPQHGRTTRGGRGGGAGSDLHAMREQVVALVAGPRVITIRHEEPVLEIESALPDSPFQQTLYTDGREFTRDSPGAPGIEGTAGWQLGGRLVAEYMIAGDRRVKETWELVAEGSRVLISTEVVGKGLVPTIRVQRVYDRVEIVPWAVPD